MQADNWGVFHDGTIEAIEGAVPGTVSVTISIPCLRAQFPGPGEGFVVQLEGCTRFDYTGYDCPPVSDLAAIAASEPEILYAQGTDESIVLDCVMGTLSLSYVEASMYTDVGQPVSPAELVAASKAYWDAWAAGFRRS